MLFRHNNSYIVFILIITKSNFIIMWVFYRLQLSNVYSNLQLKIKVMFTYINMKLPRFSTILLCIIFITIVVLLLNEQVIYLFPIQPTRSSQVIIELAPDGNLRQKISRWLQWHISNFKKIGFINLV